jgi:hypothetical protein
VEQIAPLVDSLDPAARLPLAELAMPALRQLSATQYRSFRDRIEPLIQADRDVSLFEFALQRMLVRDLDRHFDRRRPAAVRYSSVEPLAHDVSVLLSSLAYVDAPRDDEAARAFGRALGALGARGRPRTLALVEPQSKAGLERALDRLALASPAVKRRVLDACAACITSDGRVTLAEGELLRAIADSLDCPMPPLLPSTAAVPLPDEHGNGADAPSARASS